MRRSTLGLAIPSALLLAGTASAQPPRAPAPEEASSRDLYDNPLFIAGAATFLGSYGLSIGFGAASLDDENRWLYIPVAGPWVALADGHDEDDDDQWLLAFDGIAQAAGVAMIATAYFRERRQRYVEQRFTRFAVTPRSIGFVGRF